MSKSFRQLFLMNTRLVFRNRTGLFFTLIMPAIIYIALSVLPIGKALGDSGPSYSQFVLPGIIALTIMQGGIYGLAYWMIDMKSRGVIKRFLVTPISQSELILSLLASRVLIALAQIIFLTAIGVIFFSVSFPANVLTVLIFGILGASIFLLIGLLISMFADSYEAAAPITTAVGLPLTFLGNIFFPTDSLPQVLKVVSKLLPITYLADGMRRLFLDNAQWELIGKDLIILLVWFVVILGFTLWKFRLAE